MSPESGGEGEDNQVCGTLICSSSATGVGSATTLGTAEVSVVALMVGKGIKGRAVGEIRSKARAFKLWYVTARGGHTHQTRVTRAL